MRDVTSELLSAYVDGESSADDAAAVRAALLDDAALQATFEDLKSVAAFFGKVEGEPVSEAMLARLQALRPIPTLARFEPVAQAPVRQLAWRAWTAGLAAALLAAVGLFQAVHRPEVRLMSLARATLAEDGRQVTHLDARENVSLRSGDVLSAGTRERLSLRLSDGSELVLLPQGSIRLGDPSGALFSLESGTLLCTFRLADRSREVVAGGVRLYVQDAVFGARVEGAPVRAAGAGTAQTAPVTVAVTRGSLDFTRNGDRESVRAGERVFVKRGASIERSPAWQDGMYLDLLRITFGRIAREIMPGYFDAEAGVTAIASTRWRTEGGRLVLVISDPESAGAASYLVLRVRTRGAAAPLRATLILPAEGGRAETSTILTRVVGSEWTVVGLPLEAFRAEGAERSERVVGTNASSLARLELAAGEDGASIDLQSSLWAARPPAGGSEEVR
ncbi:MAG: hypothetical protein ACT4PV_01545 [Planctomycetaceae bacterium]